MNQPFERIEWMTHKDIYHHLLADLVSYLEYNLINNNNNNNNNNKNIKRYSSLQKFKLSFTHPHVVSNLSFVEHKNVLKTVVTKLFWLPVTFIIWTNNTEMFLKLSSFVFHSLLGRCSVNACVIHFCWIKLNIYKATICNVYLILSHLTQKKTLNNYCGYFHSQIYFQLRLVIMQFIRYNFLIDWQP